MTATRDTTLASLAKVARNAVTSFFACVNFVKDLGDKDDTKYTFIDAYAAGLLDVKASQVATLRLYASPDAKRPNAHGQRNIAQHKAIRAAEVAWVRVRNEAGFKPAKKAGQANNATKTKAETTVPPAPVTLQSILLPTVTDASDALDWLFQMSIKAKSFRNKNAKLFDTFGDNGMAIRDALAALTKAIDSAKAATTAAKSKPQVVDLAA